MQASSLHPLTFRFCVAPKGLVALAVAVTIATAHTAPAAAGAREPLVPEVAGSPFTVEPGPRPFRHRLALSPAYGSLGQQRLFALRVAYNPSSWLGWEAAIAHNPGQSVHALHHSLSAIVRVPFPWRIQPYVSLGFGMMLVFPGKSINADPVTKNALAAGGGIELYIRQDLAIRAELRRLGVLGSQRNDGGSVIYDYREATIGLAFYRTLGS